MANNAYITWSYQYLVGHDTLDAHHQGMFNLINRIYEERVNPSPESQIIPIL
jgi:hemerythrin